MWAKLKTYIGSWKSFVWRMEGRFWRVCGAEEKCPYPFPRAAEQEWELSRDFTAGLQGSDSFDEGEPQDSKHGAWRRQSALESIYNRAGQKQTWNRSLWLSLRDLLHKEGDTDFETQKWQSWKCSHLLLQPPLSFQCTEEWSSTLLPTAASFTWSTQLCVGMLRN